MAAARRRSSRVFLVAQDASVVGNLVFNLNLKHLFSSQPEAAELDDEPVLSLPAPVACFKQEDCYDYMAFAASPSGDVIASAGTNRRTLLYDGGGAGGAVTPGPTMCSAKTHLFLVPVSDHMFFAISAYPGSDYPQGPLFEALQQLRPGGRWAWTAVPGPPGLARHQERKDVTAFFVSGARVYVSLERKGTYSYDTARRRWRSEGPWELPVRGRAVLVPNFMGTGRRLLFGFRSSDDLIHYLCVVDMDARPPAIIASWQQPGCPPEAWHAGYMVCSYIGQLSYFGGGRFCVSTTSYNGEKPLKRGVVSFTAFELTPELHLIKRQTSCYLIPQSSRGGRADVI